MMDFTDEPLLVESSRAEHLILTALGAFFTDLLSILGQIC